MKLSWFDPRKCFRLTVPARYADDGQRRQVYFTTRDEGSKFIAALINRPALNHTVRMPQGDQVFLEEMRTLVGSNDGIRTAIEFYQKTVLSVKKQGTVFELLAAYLAWQGTMNRTLDGLKAINHWAGKFGQAFGDEMVTELNYSDLSKWINSHQGGKGHSARRNAYVFGHALVNWALKNGWLGIDIMKGMDKPGVNVLKNIMPVAQFEMILQACAGNAEFASILPVLVLKGFAGVRGCELVGQTVGQTDVVMWSDFDWADGSLNIRGEVAKRTTRKSGDQRYVVLCEAALAWLQPLALGSGPVFTGNRATFGEILNAMLKSIGQKMERNCLRHSYASKNKSEMRVTQQVEAVAKKTGKSASTLWRWVKEGCNLSSPASIKQFIQGKRRRQSNTVQKSNKENTSTGSVTDFRESEYEPDLDRLELGPIGKTGAAAALQRLEEIEERAHARLQRAIEAGNPFQIQSAQQFYLRCSETLRRLDLAIEIERRNAVELIPQKQVEAASLYIAEWLRIAFAQFLSSESRSLMGIKDPAEFRLYAIDRFRGIVFAAVKTSRKTNSPIPTWAAAQVVEAWNIPNL